MSEIVFLATMMIDIKRDFYLVFYNLLHAEFLVKTHPPLYIEEFLKKPLSPEVWNVLEKGGQPKTKVFFAGADGKCSPKTFYNIYRFFKPKAKETDPPPPEIYKIDRLTLIKALLFLEIGKGKLEKVKRRKPASEEKGGIEFNTIEVELKFDTFQATNEWTQINTEDIANSLVDAFRQQHMPTTLSKINTAIKTDIIERILEAQHIGPIMRLEISSSEKETAYSYIFDQSKSIFERKAVMNVFANKELLTDDEIVNFFYCPIDEIRIQAAHLLPLLLHKKVDPYFLFGEIIWAIENTPKNLTLINVLFDRFIEIDLGVGIEKLIFLSRDSSFAINCRDFFLVVLKKLHSMKGYLTNSEYHDKVIEDFWVSCFKSNIEFRLVNDLKFILQRQHPKAFKRWKNVISKYLGENENHDIYYQYSIEYFN